MKILFVRHCKTIANIKMLWSGLTDIDILPEHLKDLKKVADLSKAYQIDKIFCSPLKRAYQTAKAIAEQHNLEPILDQRIIERDFGILELKPALDSDKLKMCDWNLNTDLNSAVEKIQDMYYKRIKPFFDELKTNEKADSTILVVSHSWIGRLLKFYVSKEKDFEAIKEAPKSVQIYEFKI